MIKQNLKRVNEMIVQNMTSHNGNQVPNQFIIDNGNKTIFQSYKTIVAVKENGKVTLDSKALDYSATTLKYLKQFLNTSDSKKQLQAKIESGFYNTSDLN